MRELLRVAGDESQQEPWARVHAINTLRLTFSDRNLANDVSGFFADGTAIHTPKLCEVTYKHVWICPVTTPLHAIVHRRLLLFSLVLSLHVKACNDAYRPRESSYTSLCCMACPMNACCFSLVMDAAIAHCCCFTQQSRQTMLDKGSTALSCA